MCNNVHAQCYHHLSIARCHSTFFRVASGKWLRFLLTLTFCAKSNEFFTSQFITIFLNFDVLIRRKYLLIPKTKNEIRLRDAEIWLIGFWLWLFLVPLNKHYIEFYHLFFFPFRFHSILFVERSAMCFKWKATSKQFLVVDAIISAFIIHLTYLHLRLPRERVTRMHDGNSLINFFHFKRCNQVVNIQYMMSSMTQISFLGCWRFIRWTWRSTRRVYFDIPRLTRLWVKYKVG